MKYTLKNYQELAVSELVDTLDSASFIYRQTRSKAKPTRTSVSLAAVTGAGKTVMAAAMVERVFQGTPTTAADPTATFLWVSDSPDLNSQSRFRIEAALGPSRVIKTRDVGMDFREEKLQPGTLYFINIQKLTKTSTIARRHYRETDEMNSLLPVPDAGDYDFWQTIENTLQDENTTLYLIIDEAHRGMKSPKRSSKSKTSERTTIIQRIINGSGGTPPVPLVVGISATPGRFREFIGANPQFNSAPEVTVDAEMVQDSGLLKDTIVLSIPDESGDYDHALLVRGTERLKEVTSAWNGYTQREGSGDEVVPLMVVQVPDKASDTLIDSYVETIRNAYPELSIGNFAHVFGEDKPIKAGGTEIHHVQAERVQETKRIRVLFAKEAISTGWDCPRAEVLVSFRPAKDHTHITQLIGRMVRTPLARRIEGDDLLSSVTCILPKFDRKVASQVAKTVARGGTDWAGDDGGTDDLRRVLIDPETVYPIEGDDADRMWSRFKQLPTETVPAGKPNPIKQLTELAVALSTDNLLPGAVKSTDEAMFRKMQACFLEFSELEDAVEDIKNIEIEEFSTKYGTAKTVSSEKYSIQTDEHAVRVGLRNAERVFGPNLAKGFVSYLVDKQVDEYTDEDELLELYRENQIKSGALALVPKVIDSINAKAAEMADELIAKYRVEALGLRESRAAIYKSIFEQADEPKRLNIVPPANLNVATKSAEEDSKGQIINEQPIPRWAQHLLVSKKDDLFPADLNEWEQKVIETEMARPGALGWFRNAGGAANSLNIAYRKDADSWSRLRPDFIFFHEADGEVRASIVDPHSAHLGDSLPKLKAYVRFINSYPGEFHRVESVIKVKDEFRVIDINDSRVQEAILNAETAEPLFKTDLSHAYC
ncbi:DEAD/DEAH box helicase [uncultured Corynebacterium sp.]|uniref:DEAD/DEAH box helicase n=1 Tax=uncultured Corynebacterium sp. TaxID=159447 RepID=UPI002593B5D0|nr:DEAD/DEAH box helicase family protein [uncultured Corynebacterium sp.]